MELLLALVLETTFVTATGAVRLVDAMPPRQDHPRVFRQVEGLAGEVTMSMDLLTAFDYGRVHPLQRSDGHLFSMTAGPDTLQLWSELSLEVAPAKASAAFVLREGQRYSFELAWHPSYQPAPDPIVGRASLESIQRYWHRWAGQCTYDGPAREAVVCSLITLKALTYRPSGGIVAAPTTSLPEQLGGKRNWDYRYCWVRDSALVLNAFVRCGYSDEASSWRAWLRRATAGDPGRLQVLYGVRGERYLAEQVLGHLKGYAASAPVRIGNAAATQAQLDLYGELASAFSAHRRMLVDSGRPAVNGAAWDDEVALIEYLRSIWRRRDRSIWEVRDRSRHFTYSKVMAWVALDRAIGDAETFGFAAPLRTWRRSRETIHSEVCARAFDYERERFMMAYDLDALDASLLLIPAVGFLPPSDPRVVATVEAIDAELNDRGLIRRYIPGAPGPRDAQMGDEGTFLPSSFWMVDALAMIGRRDEAAERFSHLCGLANEVGLLAEEYDIGEERQLGNFPQAFTHAALVESACRLADTPH